MQAQACARPRERVQTYQPGVAHELVEEAKSNAAHLRVGWCQLGPQCLQQHACRPRCQVHLLLQLWWVEAHSTAAWQAALRQQCVRKQYEFAVRNHPPKNNQQRSAQPEPPSPAT